MSKSNPDETYAQRRHRMTGGRGLCHFHAIVYGGGDHCSKRAATGANALKLCEPHLITLSELLIPRDMVLVSRTSMKRLHEDAENLKWHRQQARPLHARIRELETKVAELTALPPRERRKQIRESVEGVVYFLHSDSVVKIGWTSDLDQRLKQYSPGARLLAIKPGTRADEAKLHKKFAHLKTNRKEWFSYSPQVMEEVQRTIREHGEPPRDINEPLTATRIVGPRLDNYIGGKSKSA